MQKEVTNATLAQIDASLIRAQQITALKPITSTVALQNRYYVERFFLERYFADKGSVTVDGVVLEPCDPSQLPCSAIIPSDQGLCITVETHSLSNDSSDKLQFIYFGNNQLPFWMGHGLAIIDSDDNMVYLRDSDQDPITAWEYNELANDLKDETENFIFPGEPVQY